MKKGEILENIEVETMASEGKCVGRINGQVIFLEGCAPGDIVDAQLTKIKSSFLEATVTRIVKPSPNRFEPFCVHFGLCGGCSWQHIQYQEQLQYKQKQVTDNLERIGGLTLPPVTPIFPSAKTRFYRNKLDYTFSAQRWFTKEELAAANGNPIPPEPVLGYHIPRKYDRVFDVKECHLQPDPSNAIRLAAKDEALKHNIPFFDLRKQIGFLRTLTIRTANTGEVMVILQVTYDKMEWIEKILTRLERDFPQITSFQYVINGKKNDTFADLNIECWKGNPYITEKMPRPDGSGDLQFRVGPKSFYQTNSDQAYELYRLAWELAQLQPHELVYDLYTGTGTIANFVAGHAKKVVGLEYVQEAIADAKINSQINNIGNTDFYAGDIKNLLNDSFLQQHGRPDVIITDPPRAGMHEDVTRMILKAEPKRIVYVSCGPATQARDLKILSEKYRITAVQPVDMFPHTMHVENIAALVKV
ncbi:23S rRNA (uracil(1939)-C(5))-methyltransferase RlmD [Fulvivirgaceae bacterium PWU4]|uniref:23S rRNA (Uracil(1939)-C(5))-methyltransferase RlmD n=1 Tax=Chryseosolibacter histidini TaxID=2782349 RepID=A0AAP2GLQ3_9BACT|nr:23S rRNA (uracil(1939)-C(5))-methyltransferase RlmD [Chryseosolibacter histidini]MBT1696083.1 23S rRNA (uracil(1939)-C(5))-methyltransferase RlmD [Chryseosolibacter histidini]